MTENQDYLGDVVYAEWTGYSIILKANDHLNPTDKIELDFRTIKSLLDFKERMEGENE